MKFSQLTDQIARLESVNDQLTAEIAYVDALLKQLGFDEGLESLKLAANEVLGFTDEFNKKNLN